eukprot:8612747-Prorocentrum_lima.AAC.1
MASDTVSHRIGQYGQRAKEWLRWIDEEKALQAALLRDAADESLMIARLRDHEETGAAVLTRELQNYLSQISKLFCHGE